MTDYSETVKEMGFEQAMEELEKLVKELEAGGIDLDRSIEIYEKAVVLRDHCKRILDDSERRIQKIMESSGAIKAEDFGPERSRSRIPSLPPIPRNRCGGGWPRRNPADTTAAERILSPQVRCAGRWGIQRSS